MSTVVHPRKPRYRRTAAPPPLELWERDILLLAAVHRYRFLTAPLFHLLVGGSKQKLQRRLALLWQHGYLDRPRSPIRFRVGGGSQPIPYALGNKGATLLAENFPTHFVRGGVDWTEKNRITDPKYIPHTLGIADVMARLTASCRGYELVRIIEREEILRGAPEATRRRKNPYSWSVTVERSGKEVKRGVLPDALFGLHFPTEQEGRARAYFFLEVDRATEPVTRHDDLTVQDDDQSSFFKKLSLYFATYRQKLHTAHYGMKNFRVLVVTTSPARVEHLIKANQVFNNGQGSRLFYFTTFSELAESENLLMHKWRNGCNEIVTLLD